MLIIIVFQIGGDLLPLKESKWFLLLLFFTCCLEWLTYSFRGNDSMNQYSACNICSLFINIFSENGVKLAKTVFLQFRGFITLF